MAELESFKLGFSLIGPDLTSFIVRQVVAMKDFESWKFRVTKINRSVNKLWELDSNLRLNHIPSEFLSGDVTQWEIPQMTFRIYSMTISEPDWNGGLIERVVYRLIYSRHRMRLDLWWDQGGIAILPNI